MTVQQPYPDSQPEEIPVGRSSVSPSPRRSNRAWWTLLAGAAIGMLCLLSLVAGAWLFLLGRGMAEINDMGPWPGPEVRPAEMIQVDLSTLGLQAGRVKNARNEDTWSNGVYQDGVMIDYISGAKTAVTIWALRYEQPEAAGLDYGSARVLVESGLCGAYTTAYLGNAGILHCRLQDGYVKLFWNENWIVNILAHEGTGVDSAILVDQVRDALAVHWKQSVGQSD